MPPPIRSRSWEPHLAEEEDGLPNPPPESPAAALEIQYLKLPRPSVSEPRGAVRAPHGGAAAIRRRGAPAIVSDTRRDTPVRYVVSGGSLVRALLQRPDEAFEVVDCDKPARSYR